MSRYALSTSWNSSRHNDGTALIQEIQNAGFNHIEAEYRLTAEMLAVLVALHKRNEINIVSLHNFCPIPDILKREQGSGDALLLTSLDEEERNLAVKYSKKTIELAHELDGVPVVFHTGHFDIKGQSRELTTQNLVKLIQQDKLGIENRYFYFDIPDFEEMGVILTEFAGGSIGYWHDVGHAQMFEYLGIRKHHDFLDAYADKMIGIHLHDMVEDRDHQAPGKGNIDFSMVAKYLKPETIRVLEVHPPETAEDLRAGVEVLRSAGI
jgi:sugar phosphate isomerase/epimerase